MRCGTARRLLWLTDGPGALTPAAAETVEHLRACGACSAFLSGQRQLAGVIREQTPKPPAPPALRDRVFAAVARERVRVAARAEWLVRIATLLLVVGAIAAGLVWSWRGSWADRAWQNRIALLTTDHGRALQGESLASSDVAAVREWLGQRLSFGVHVPVIPSAPITEARVRHFNGRVAAALRLEVDGTSVSFYVTPVDASDPSRLGPGQFITGAHNGYEFVAWQGAGLLHVLVGGVPEARLRALARYCLDLPAAEGRL